MIVLTRYLAWTVVTASLVALAAIVALNFVFSLVDSVAAGDRDTGEAALQAILAMPGQAYEAFPFATLIGSLTGLGGLAARHELTVMRAAGVSVLQVAFAAMAGGLLLALIATAMGEWVVPPAEDRAAAMRGLTEADRLRSGPDGALWARDGRDFLRVERPRSSAHLEEVVLYRFADGELVERVEAEAMHYIGGAWELREVGTTRFGAAAVETERVAAREWAGEIRPEVLEVVVADPEALPLVQLATYIRYLERNELESDRYRLAFWVKIATPLATLTMILVTVPLVFVSGRSGGAGQRIVIGVLVGIVFFLVNRALGQAGVVYGLAPALSALLPVALFFALGLAGTLRVR